MEKHWFVFYTKSRQEKKVDELLKRNGYESFLPLQTSMRQWSDRKKKVIAPLFNSYIFVNAFQHEIPSILTTPGIAWNILLEGKPAVVRENEIQTIRRFLSSGLFLETGPADQSLKAGDVAEIIDGPLAGTKGIILKDNDEDKFIVEIGGIRQFIKVQIPAYLLKKG